MSNQLSGRSIDLGMESLEDVFVRHMPTQCSMEIEGDMMRTMNATDLQDILRAAGGDTTIGNWSEILDHSFDDIGYDSLALLEAAGEIQRQYGVCLADDALTQTLTPKNLLALVNANIEAKSTQSATSQ